MKVVATVKVLLEILLSELTEPKLVFPRIKREIVYCEKKASIFLPSPLQETKTTGENIITTDIAERKRIELSPGITKLCMANRKLICVYLCTEHYNVQKVNYSNSNNGDETDTHLFLS